MAEFDAFLEWVSDRFPDYEISNDEIKINSVFTSDTGRHLWCNPDKNCYHCWKTDESGNLFELICHVDKCGFDEARHVLGSDNYIRNLESKLAKWKERQKTPPPPPEPMLALPPNTCRIDALAEPHLGRACQYLESRKLPPGDLMYCPSGEFRDRLIIPYYDAAGKLVYWNSRDVTGKAKLRYRGPDKDVAKVGKGDVLWMSKWPTGGEKVYLTEGEFDAMSLASLGLNAGACGGKEVGQKQISLLKPYHVSISFDNDKSGQAALNKVGMALLASGVQRVSFIRPPMKIKDWNQMLVEAGAEKVKAYIRMGEKIFNPWTSSMLRFHARE